MRKLILITMIIVAMIGTVTAEQINIYEPGTTNKVNDVFLVPGGAVVVKDLVISEFGSSTGVGTTHTITDDIEVYFDPTTGLATVNDIQIRYRETVPSVGLWGSDAFTWTQSSVGGASSSELLEIELSAVSTAPVGAKYTLYIEDYDGISTSTPPKPAATFTIYATMVPEFPTIALPVAAILGLVFLFQRRKEE